MKVLHISAECYPAAKAGGLGDVVGALPKYLNKAGISSGVIIPKYRLKWIESHRFTTVYRGAIRMHNYFVPFTIEQEADDSLGFSFFVANIPGLFDRPGIYADPGGYMYNDEVQRYLCFQQAVLQWIVQSPGKPAILHCHDHHTGLIPFMVKHCPDYWSLGHIPTVFTIHNGAYHGAFSWEKMYLMPFFQAEARGLLDWANTVCPLAAAIKCAWRVTTVSPSYLDELRHQSNGMEGLFWHEQHKCYGLINGIDAQVWNPGADKFIAKQLDKDIDDYKAQNKRALTQHFKVDPNLPLISFIGRLVGEKGADLLPSLIGKVLQSGMRVAFIVQGTGDPHVQDELRHLAYHNQGKLDVAIEYNEGLAHQIYAGTDFLLMPSRIEPCGLNQMYSMRYGTLPIVRAVGGLKDTVPDIGEPDGQGRGIRFSQFTLEDAALAIYRAVEFYYHHHDQFKTVRSKIMQIDFSWERSANAYIDIYNELA